MDYGMQANACDGSTKLLKEFIRYGGSRSLLAQNLSFLPPVKVQNICSCWHRGSEYLILFVLAYPLQLVLQSLKHSLVMLTDSLVIVFCSMPYTLSKEQSHSEEFQTFLLREIAIIQGSQPHLQK
jgi:hypothetical protein